MAEKVRHIRGQTAGDEHVLIVPGERDETLAGDRSRTYFIASPLISRTSRYRVPLRLDAVGRILEKERPDLIECGDPYQVAWKTVHSGVALGIPVVRFYHSHFPEAYIRTVRKFPGGTVTELFKDFSRRYIRARYSWERVFTRLFMLYREVIADYLRQGAYRRLDASRSQELGNESEKGRVLRASSIPRAATSQCGCSWRSDVIPQFGLSLRLLAHCVGIYLLCGYCRQACGAHHLGTSRFFWALSAMFNGVPFLLLAVTGRFTEVYHGFVFQFAAHKFGYSQGERVEWVCKAMVLGWMPIATWLSRIVLSKTRAEETGAE